MITEIKCF